MSLRDLFEVAAAEVEPVTVGAGPDGSVTWSRDGTVFATLDEAGTTATFRLDAILAAAAQRTPDTAAGVDGPEWVRFSPTTLDPQARDRAQAWFVAAHRRALA